MATTLSSARLVTFQPVGLADLPFRVLEHAYWRPQAARVPRANRQRGQKKDAETARIIRARRGWRREETWINDCFEAVLTSLPSHVSREWVAHVAAAFDLGKPRVVALDYAGLRSLTGKPDFALMGDDAIVLGECKVGTHRRSARYTFQQYGKYMGLAALCRCSANRRLPRQVVHLILAPTTDPRRFLNDYADWQPAVIARQLVFSPAKVRLRGGVGGATDHATWRDQLAKLLRGKAVQRNCPLDRLALDELLDQPDVPIARTFVWAWAEAGDKLASICAAQNLDTQVQAVHDIVGLATNGAIAT